MRRERTESFIECDACGRYKDEPHAIAGYHDGGWRQVGPKDEYDLCSVCYGTLLARIIESIGEQGFDKEFKKLLKNTKKIERNGLNVDWNLKF